MNESTTTRYATIIAPLAEELRSDIELCRYAFDELEKVARVATSPAEGELIHTCLCEIANGFRMLEHKMIAAARAVQNEVRLDNVVLNADRMDVVLEKARAFLGSCAAGCGRPRLDGHKTCGDVKCKEARFR